MVFKNYQVQILFRLLLIVANCFAVLYVWQLHAYWLSFYNLLLLVVLQVYLLFRFLTRWQQDIRVFANSVKHGDYNITYHLIDKHDPHAQLYHMLNHVSAYVRQVKSEYVQQNHYFQYVVENAQVGLIAFDSQGKVLLSNHEATALMRMNGIENIHEFKGLEPDLYTLLKSESINQSRLVMGARDRSLKLSVRLSKFIIDQRPVYLLSLLNIRPELEENELQSWQELISVLTHEIMNSITPIHSLNGNLTKYLDRIEGNEELVQKAKQSLQVVNRRSESLMSFVDRYRKISTVPLPHKATIDIGMLLGEVVELMSEELQSVSVTLKHNHEKVNADHGLIEQVIINVIKNAISSYTAPNRELNISVALKANDVVVLIRDNGKGIPPAMLDKVFIPFFTTREGGSGIGLTLSRQIMHRHGGTMEIASTEGTGTTVQLVFKT